MKNPLSFARTLPKPTLALLFALFLPAWAPAQRVVAWGNDDYGQSDVPGELYNVTRISAGGFHSLSLRADGTVAAWGWDIAGETDVPAGLSGVTQISAGQYHSLALGANGSVTVWGDNDYNERNIPAGLGRVDQVAAGSFHCLALKHGGTVVAWGYNEYGQTNVPAGLAGVTQVAGGFGHSLALRQDGTVTGWGMDVSGQCDVPAGLAGVAQISAGYFHSLALKADGTVVAWGQDDLGQADVPAGLSGVTQVAGGQEHSLALKSDGTVVAWGSNDSGQCDVPAGLTGVLQVSAGFAHSMALVAAAHCVLDQSQLYAGGSATGTVKLATPAGEGGDTVGLILDASGGVHIPVSVTVPEGETSVTFPVTTDLDFSDGYALIETSYRDTPTVPASLSVIGVGATLTANHPTVYGGSTTKELLTLTVGHPLDADQAFAIDNSAPDAVAAPSSVTLKAGKASVSFYVTPGLVAAEQPCHLAVRYGGNAIAGADLDVKPISGTLGLLPADLYGGDPSQGTIALNAPVAAALTIPLSVSRPVASVPASVTVAAGSKTASFPIATNGVAKPIADVVTAQINGKAVSGTLHLTPKSNLQSVTLASYVYGHGRIVGTVKLSSPAPAGGEVVVLGSSDPDLAIPASVTLLSGATQGTFTAEASDVDTVAAATVTATFAGNSVLCSTQLRPLAVSSLTLSAATVAGGSGVTGTVNLNVAVSVATVVYLTSDNLGVASVPATVTVPAGSRTVAFIITTTSPATVKYVKITASKNGTSAYRTLKVMP